MPKKEIDIRLLSLFGPTGFEAFIDVIISKLNALETAAGLDLTTKDTLLDESIDKVKDITIITTIPEEE